MSRSEVEKSSYALGDSQAVERSNYSPFGPSLFKGASNFSLLIPCPLKDDSNSFSFGPSPSKDDSNSSLFGPSQFKQDFSSFSFSPSPFKGDSDPSPFDPCQFKQDSNSFPFGPSPFKGDSNSSSFGLSLFKQDYNYSSFGLNPSKGDSNSSPFGPNQLKHDSNSSAFGSPLNEDSNSSRPLKGDPNSSPFSPSSFKADSDYSPFGSNLLKEKEDSNSSPYSPSPFTFGRPVKEDAKCPTFGCGLIIPGPNPYSKKTPTLPPTKPSTPPTFHFSPQSLKCFSNIPQLPGQLFQSPQFAEKMRSRPKQKLHVDQNRGRNKKKMFESTALTMDEPRPSPFPEVVTAIPALVLPFPGILPSSMNHNYFNFQTAPSSGIESYPASLAPFGYSTGHPGYILAMPLQLCYMPPTYHTHKWSSVIYHY